MGVRNVRKEGEVAMTKSKRVMKRHILSLMFNRLQEVGAVEQSREAFLSSTMTLHDLDALLAFRTDPMLDELRAALERMETGTYGLCLCCKSPISQEVLDRDPAQRMCGTCEQQFVHQPRISAQHYPLTM